MTKMAKSAPVLETYMGNIAEINNKVDTMWTMTNRGCKKCQNHTHTHTNKRSKHNYHGDHRTMIEITTHLGLDGNILYITEHIPQLKLYVDCQSLQ